MTFLSTKPYKIPISAIVYKSRNFADSLKAWSKEILAIKNFLLRILYYMPVLTIMTHIKRNISTEKNIKCSSDNISKSLDKYQS